jgi:hypothetical protein
VTVSRRQILLSAGTTALAAGLTVQSATAGIAAPSVMLPPTSYPLRLTDIVLRDPFMVVDAASAHYYLYVANDMAASGVPGVGTMVYRSTDLKHWASPVVVFQPTPDLWARSGAWAPEVHRWRGRWYLFTTLYDTKKPLPLKAPNSSGLPLQLAQHARGTVIAVADSLLGPFTVVDPAKPVAPASFMTLDGTLFKDDKGRPWMVYAHEWVQKIDGTMEAIPLKQDLTGASGKPIHLFKARTPPGCRRRCRRRP